MGRMKMTKGSFDEYLVGKRDMGPIITGAALSATYISGWAFCGSTGIVYSLGFSGMWFAGIWSLIGIIPCIWLGALKTRDFSKKLGAATLPETIGRRFESKGLQTIVAVSMLFFLFLYSVGQLKAGATVWFAMTGLSPLWCLLLSVFIAWLYMVLGGLHRKPVCHGLAGSCLLRRRHPPRPLGHHSCWWFQGCHGRPRGTEPRPDAAH